MNKKKVLIVARGFFPEQSPRAFRATELAKELCRQGHQVTVLIPYRENIEPLLKEFPIEYINLGTLKWKISNLDGRRAIGALYNKVVNRLLPLLFEFPSVELFFKVKKKLKSENKKYDLLISIAVPYSIHWGVAAVWSKNKANNIAPIWIADCGDPFYFQENDTFQKPFYFKWIEKWFMKKADYIAVPTETSYMGYFPEFYSKLRVIPQGFRVEDVNKKEVMQDGIVRFGYGGAMALHRRDPTELLMFLTSLDKTIAFEFHVYTENKNFIESFSKKDSRIKLHEPISRLELLEILSSFQFVVNMANFGTAQTPSKLIDYSIIEKPILQIETGNLNKKTVLEFLEGNYENGVGVIDIEQYRIENVVNQFLKLEINV